MLAQGQPGLAKRGVEASSPNPGLIAVPHLLRHHILGVRHGGSARLCCKCAKLGYIFRGPKPTPGDARLKSHPWALSFLRGSARGGCRLCKEQPGLQPLFIIPEVYIQLLTNITSRGVAGCNAMGIRDISKEPRVKRTEKSQFE